MPRFKVINLMVPEKKIFKGFLTYMGMATILVMCDLKHMSIISFLPPIKVPYQNFTSIGPVVSEKKMFGIWNLSDLSQRSLNGPDLCYP